MDRAISSAIQNRRVRQRWLLVLAALLVVVGGLWAFRRVLRPSINQADLLTTIVETGDVEATITASGVVIPAREAVVTSPIQSTIRRVLLTAGDEVKPGQPIVELDKEMTSSNLAKLQDEQLQNQNKSSVLQLSLERTLNDLEAQEQVQQEKVRSLQSALRDEQHLLGIGSGTQENVRQAELNLKIAQLELQKVRRQMANQRRSNQADERGLGYTRQIQARSIAELARELQQATISADQAGVLTWVSEDVGGAVSKGQVLARVADLSSFRVRATVADTYADSLHVGDAVRVRLGGTDLAGSIASISPAVEKGVVTFYARLRDNHHPVLRANQRAEVYVVTRAHPRVTRVKNGPFYQGGREQSVFVLQDGNAVRRTVRFGDANFDYVQVVQGLRPGEEMIMTDMKDYEQVNELSVK
ncbi:HlyD family efflux transporter periplasmic adaptor subunit [Hymenobacter sp. BT18]|uniref:efflux RND transporter periplasmic adaptor subunit n=1 Tax=Hymenobacter sp. BT18 TaxID=2835648 RepID=UPI00143E66E1|nr:HlyD family efflux transporter periplasmic adaptor subunit [Hymenobacter sp. BT18]QIX63077.1 HlyD family efflux transporter periplasmic adaptor subunit [Hymenobacter sp. BT18]